jgi:hypothetical protein
MQIFQFEGLCMLHLQKCSLHYVLNVQNAEISRWYNYFKYEMPSFTCVQRDEELKRGRNEAARLRKEYIHKANRTWHYKLTNVMSPGKPLIDVHSPTFTLCQRKNSKLTCLLVHTGLKTKLVGILKHIQQKQCLGSSVL